MGVTRLRDVGGGFRPSPESSLERFVERFMDSPKYDEVYDQTETKTGHRSVVVGTITIRSDYAVKPGLSVSNVLCWAAAKCAFCMANILINLAERVDSDMCRRVLKDAQMMDAVGRKYWLLMHKGVE